MDTNGMPIEGFYSTNVPAGLGAAPPLSANLLPSAEKTDGYEELNQTTESEMEKLILEFKAAHSDRQAEKILREKVSDRQMDRVLDRLEEDMLS
ncbi:MAG: hypothetical protein IJ716_12275 [Lachnospiraceae bacterium]|nr:hypothetical protein [Lachnospiraceae bacterium]